jgi:hypothetical protein
MELWEFVAMGISAIVIIAILIWVDQKGKGDKNGKS